MKFLSPVLPRSGLEKLLTRFRERLKGLRGWHEVLDRLRWVTVQVEAWLGHPRRARATLERARFNHLSHSPHRYALAIGVDKTLIYCRHLPAVHIRTIRRIIKACKQNLKLEAEIRRNLNRAARQLGKRPGRAREILGGPAPVVRRAGAGAAGEYGFAGGVGAGGATPRSYRNPCLTTDRGRTGERNFIFRSGAPEFIPGFPNGSGARRRCRR